MILLIFIRSVFNDVNPFHLNSIMILLISLANLAGPIGGIVFKFHYDSINFHEKSLQIKQKLVYLNSIMILLISVSNLILSSSFSFKFHYDSINFDFLFSICYNIFDLNSIMILLISCRRD